MLIEYKCPHCPEWHNLGDWTDRDIRNFMMMLVVSRRPFVPEPFSRDEWLLVLGVELNRRNRNNG